MDRREFLKVVPVMPFSTALAIPRAGPVTGVHPEPRPGIDASEVLTEDALAGQDSTTQMIYQMVREIPQIADGIACYCGCAFLPTYRSLLTCYYADGMAAGCRVCQLEARLAHSLHQQGKTLQEIRDAVDARFA